MIRTFSQSSFLCAVLLLPSFAGGQETDSRALFQSTEPSVVLITDAEGGGSGLVITADGMILTNYHVVNSPLPKTVEALVEEHGKTVRKTFANARLLKAHSKSDLALLKVDPAGCRFKPAKLSKSVRDTAAGGSCYAIGFPFVPGQNKPVLTITKGIISSANRTVNGNPYIQLDAAINPGNSGGALLNDKGMVIGIPTLKFEGADRIGLATPLAGLAMDQFVNPEDRKGDPKEAERLSSIAGAMMARDTFSFGTNPEAVAIAVYLQREALALEPNNPQWSFNISSMYDRLRNYPLALAYAESAVKKDSNNIFSLNLLASLYDRVKEPQKAMEARIKCLRLPPRDGDKGARMNVFDKLASYFVSNGEPARALYITSWAAASEDDTKSTEHRLVLQKCGRVIPQALIDEIMAKKSGHSVEDMLTFAKRVPTTPPVADNNPPPAVETNTLTVKSTPLVFTETVNLPSGVTARLMDCPSDVIFHEDQKLLEWTPLPFSKASEAKVLFLLTNPDGHEEISIQTISRK